jgi:hypothetical protein
MNAGGALPRRRDPRDRPPDHHLADPHGCSVGRRITHSTPQVRVHRQVQGAQQDFSLGRCRNDGFNPLQVNFLASVGTPTGRERSTTWRFINGLLGILRTLVIWLLGAATTLKPRGPILATRFPQSSAKGSCFSKIIAIAAVVKGIGEIHAAQERHALPLPIAAPEQIDGRTHSGGHPHGGDPSPNRLRATQD